MASKYDRLTTDDFDRILRELMNDTWPSTCAILEVPGVYELVSEHLNNEVLDRWDEEQAEHEEAQEAARCDRESDAGDRCILEAGHPGACECRPAIDDETGQELR